MKKIIFLSIILIITACSQINSKSSYNDDVHFSFAHYAKPNQFHIPIEPDQSTLTNRQKILVDQAIIEFYSRRNSSIKIYIKWSKNNKDGSSRLAEMIKTYMHHAGVKKGEVSFAYQTRQKEETADVTLRVYGLTGIRQKECGYWPQDILHTVDMKPYENFGCSVTNNLAAHMDNINDPFKPRKLSAPDGQRINNTLENYRSGKLEMDSEIKR